MKDFAIYRKRIIPEECILLKGDEILSFENNSLITKWEVLHPREDFSHGISGYYLEDGFKVSKFLRKDGSLIYWYIDIISHEWTDENTLVVTDLLADILIYPDGFVKVVDIDELADALEDGKITKEQLSRALRVVDGLLKKIYSGEFKSVMENVEKFG